MLSEEDRSCVIIRLEEIYELADKRLSELKQSMIISDIEDAGMQIDYILKKCKQLKSIIISGAGVKFDTSLLYRVFGMVSKNANTNKPKQCNKCDDGYIMAIQFYGGAPRELAFACDCDLGQYRKRIEKIAQYKMQEKTDNQKLRISEIDFKIDSRQISRQLEAFGIDEKMIDKVNQRRYNVLTVLKRGRNEII